MVEEITAIIKVEELKQSITLARQLHQSITTLSSVLESETTDEISEHLTAQAELVQQLLTALSVVQIETFQNACELSQCVDNEALSKVSNAVAKLQADLTISKISAVEISAAVILDVKELGPESKDPNQNVTEIKQEEMAEKETNAEKSFDSDKTVIEKTEWNEIDQATAVTQVAATVKVVKENDNVCEVEEEVPESVATENKDIEKPILSNQETVEEIELPDAGNVSFMSYFFSRH